MTIFITKYHKIDITLSLSKVIGLFSPEYRIVKNNSDNPEWATFIHSEPVFKSLVYI